MDSTATTVAWTLGFMSLIGAFMTVLVTIALSRLGGIVKKLDQMEDKIDLKMDQIDHDKQAETCTQNIRNAFAVSFGRLDEKIIVIEKKFCNHYHNDQGDLSFRKM